MKLTTSVYAMLCVALPAAATAQGMPGMKTGDPPEAATHEAMAGHLMEGAHMRMTPMRAATAADSIRATAVADTLRRALAKYADPAAAERDGYKLFAPNIKTQRVYHYAKWTNGLKAVFTFDAAKPTAILYKKDSAGKMKLVGAMYTMPKGASVDRLDKRVPLGIAEWHEHINICLPKKGDERRYAETVDGKMKFGPMGSIESKDVCNAANGRFIPVLGGWMVHANVFEGTDLKSVWAEEH